MRYANWLRTPASQVGLIASVNKIVLISLESVLGSPSTLLFFPASEFLATMSHSLVEEVRRLLGVRHWTTE